MRPDVAGARSLELKFALSGAQRTRRQIAIGCFHEGLRSTGRSHVVNAIEARMCTLRCRHSPSVTRQAERHVAAYLERDFGSAPGKTAASLGTLKGLARYDVIFTYNL
jgi:hypothetical protein